MRLRVGIWLASLLLFLVSLFIFGPLLPERVATHFGAAGQANGWMARPVHLLVFGLFGLGFSSFFILLCYAIRFLPPALLNVPHPEYWRSPEHYPAACAFIFHESFWLGALAALWVTALQVLTFTANRHIPAHLDSEPSNVVMIAFLVATLLWIARLYWHFAHVPKATAA
jgi:hypothetical protein